MKKLLLLLLFIPFLSFGQTWQYYEKNDPFDGKTLYVSAKGYGGEFPYESPGFYIRYKVKKELLEVFITSFGSAGCDNNRLAISYNNNPDDVVGYRVTPSIDNDAIFINTNFLKLFEKLISSSVISVEFRSDCDFKRFSYSLSGSSNSINKFLNNYKEYNIKVLQKKRQEEEKKKQEQDRINKIFLEKEEERKRLLSIRDSSIAEIAKALKDSMSVNGISESDIIELETSLIRALNKHYDIYDDLERVSSVIPKLHTDELLRNLGKHRAYILSTNGRETIIDSRFSFHLKSDKILFEKRYQSFKEDVEFLKLRENKNYNIDARISVESERIFTKAIYDTIIVKEPKSPEEIMEFEVAGFVNIAFANSQNNTTVYPTTIFGNWQVEIDSPILESVNSEFKFFELLIENVMTGYDRQDLFDLRKYIKADIANIKTINSLSFYKKRGKLSKYQYENGLRFIQANLTNQKPILLRTIVDTKNNKLIFKP